MVDLIAVHAAGISQQLGNLRGPATEVLFVGAGRLAPAAPS